MSVNPCTHLVPEAERQGLKEFYIKEIKTWKDGSYDEGTKAVRQDYDMLTVFGTKSV